MAEPEVGTNGYDTGTEATGQHVTHELLGVHRSNSFERQDAHRVNAQVVEDLNALIDAG